MERFNHKSPLLFEQAGIVAGVALEPYQANRVGRKTFKKKPTYIAIIDSAVIMYTQVGW